MWSVFAELIRVVRESLADWPRTTRLLLVMAAFVVAVVLLR